MLCFQMPMMETSQLHWHCKTRIDLDFVLPSGQAVRNWIERTSDPVRDILFVLPAFARRCIS